MFWVGCRRAHMFISSALKYKLFITERLNVAVLNFNISVFFVTIYVFTGAVQTMVNVSFTTPRKNKGNPQIVALTALTVVNVSVSYFYFFIFLLSSTSLWQTMCNKFFYNPPRSNSLIINICVSNQLFHRYQNDKKSTRV